MDHVFAEQNGRSVLRWGGLAGVLGAIFMLMTFVIVGAFVVPVAVTPEELVSRFPDIRAARTVENGLYLAAVALWVIHVAALAHVLGKQRPAPAVFGRAIATLGLLALAAGALPHIATLPISDLYHAQGATTEQRAALVQLFQATQGMFDALLVTGLLVLPLGLVSLGMAMRGSPAFGAWSGGLVVGLGVIGFASGLANLVEVSEIVAIGVFALIAFNLVVGVKMYRLSREPGRALVPAAAMQGG
jgi:hypothetical protein